MVLTKLSTRRISMSAVKPLVELAINLRHLVYSSMMILKLSSNEEKNALLSSTRNMKVSILRIWVILNQTHRCNSGREKIFEQEWVLFTLPILPTLTPSPSFASSNANNWAWIFFHCLRGSARQIIRLIVTSRTHCESGHPKLRKGQRCQERLNKFLCKYFSCSFVCCWQMMNSQDFQFFPPELTALQERELAVYKAWSLSGLSLDCLFIHPCRDSMVFPLPLASQVKTIRRRSLRKNVWRHRSSLILLSHWRRRRWRWRRNMHNRVSVTGAGGISNSLLEVWKLTAGMW